MSRRRLRSAIQWWCDDAGLSLVAPNGRRTSVEVRSYTANEMVVRVLGRDHKFAYKAPFVRKVRLYDEPGLTEAEHYGIWEFAHAFTGGAFAGFQKNWVPKETYIWIEGLEPVKVRKVRPDGLTVIWHGNQYIFWPGMSRIERHDDRDLPACVWKACFHLAALLCPLLPVPKSQDEKDAEAIRNAPDAPLFTDAPAMAPPRKRRHRPVFL